MIPFVTAPDLIVVHHSLTKDSGTVSWTAIRHYHTATLGWDDIGYHAGVELVKNGDLLYYEALMGRQWHFQGAHARGNTPPSINTRSLGICFVGNFDVEPPPLGQLVQGGKVIKMWMHLYGIPIGNVKPHSAFDPKSCPGTLFDMSELKSIILGLA